jgi:hypothetical protein
MYAWIRAQLERESGRDIETWNAAIKAQAPVDEPALRAWLSARGVDGYPAMLLAFETFGYPDYLQRDAEELIDGQYRDRPNLVPIYRASYRCAALHRTRRAACQEELRCPPQPEADLRRDPGHDQDPCRHRPSARRHRAVRTARGREIDRSELDDPQDRPGVARRS